MDQIENLMASIRNFATKRDWEKFHTPKNLAMAIAGEAGELVAEFQWLTPEESNRSELSSEKLRDIRLEMADVQIYLLRLADVLGIDITEAVREKMELNQARF
ncbi:MazG Predicted pyrophosphatase [Candidatus Nanopelagicaceae bacterium]